MALVKDYLQLTKQFKMQYGEYTILFMQNGAFFEVYSLKQSNDTYIGSNIQDFATVCDLNVVDKKIPGGDLIVDNLQVVNAGFKTHLLDKYLKKMQDQGYTVVVYEETGEDPVRNTKIRTQTGVYSPGTYFYTDSDNHNLTNNIACIWVETHRGTLKVDKHKTMLHMGVAIIDVHTGCTYLTENSVEYIDNPVSYDHLERTMSIYRPSETILISTLPKNNMQNILQYVNVQSKSIHLVPLNEISENTTRALNCEKQTYQYATLSKFYSVPDMHSFVAPFYERVYATQAFCFVLDFVYRHNPHLTNQLKEPIIENASNHLTLANHSLQQLNIIEDHNHKGKFSSVCNLLNDCITPMGKRQFSQLLFHPVTNETWLKQTYDCTEKLMQEMGGDYNCSNYVSVKSYLQSIRDVEKYTRLIMMCKFPPKLMYQLYQSLQCTLRLHSHIYETSPVLVTHLLSMSDVPKHCRTLLNFIDSHVNIEACQDTDSYQSYILPGVDRELDEIVVSWNNATNKVEACRRFFSSIIGKTEKKNKSRHDDDDREFVSLHETEKLNVSLISTDRRCKIIEECLKPLGAKLTIDDFELTNNLEFVRQSASKKYITNSELNVWCRAITTSKLQLNKVLGQVYERVVEQMKTFNESLNAITQFVADVDVSYCRAYIALKHCYCKPFIADADKSHVNATQLRHCLIEKIHQHELYIGNDVSLGGTSSIDGMLLYGTNAVGKTSFIRAIGVAVVMAQAGLFVSASSFTFKPYTQLFTRILGNDNLFKGLSTFAVEMSELRTILKCADNRSLVLGDELCSGTESISAVSIFVSGVQFLARKQTSFVFATHLHEISTFDEITELTNVSLNHMSVHYDQERDCLVYDRRLKDGAGTSLYGLEVCKSLSLPAEFLENAHQLRLKYHPEMMGALNQKTSKYNAVHLSGGMCEKCGQRPATDVHHLAYQQNANQAGHIHAEQTVFHKNNAANLANVCQTCHDEIHKSNQSLKKTKTTAGWKLL